MLGNLSLKIPSFQNIILNCLIFSHPFETMFGMQS